MKLSRRQFHRWMGTTIAVAACSRRSFGFVEGALRLGLNTWSLRALSQNEAIPVIIQVMKQARLQDCEILFSHVEPAKFNPVFPVGILSAPKSPPTPSQLQEQKEIATALTDWRLSVPMSYFDGIRSTFEKQDLRIKAYTVRLGTSVAEIDRQFLMAKALGADSVIARVPEPRTSLVAAAAEKHRMVVGLQFSDIAVLRKQLAASGYFRIDPDIGDLTKAKVNALQFVEDNYQSMSALDLKDAMAGGVSVPFGEGNSNMKEVLQFLQEKQVAITAYVDCDYAGTGRSTNEVKRCVSYIRSSIGNV